MKPLENGRLKKGVLGGWILRGACPQCSAGLQLKEAELSAGQDRCPDCGTLFSISPKFLQAIEKERTEAQVAKQKLAAAAAVAKERELRDREAARIKKIREEEEWNREEEERRRLRIQALQALAREQREAAALQEKKSPADLVKKSLSEGMADEDVLYPGVNNMLTTLWTLICVGSFFIALIAIAGLLNALTKSREEGVSQALVFGPLLCAVFASTAVAWLQIQLVWMMMSIDRSNRRIAALLSMQIANQAANDSESHETPESSITSQPE